MERQAEEECYERWSSMTILEYETRISNNGITNLSSTKLSRIQIETLGNNLKFIPSRNILNYHRDDLAKDLDQFKKRVFLKTIYQNENSIDDSKFYIKNPNSYHDITQFLFYQQHPNFNLAFNLSNSITIPNEINSFDLKKSFNLNHQQRNTLQKLLSKKEITFKPADKNLGLVIIDTETYILDVETILKDTSTYQITNIERVIAEQKKFQIFCKNILIQYDFFKNYEFIHNFLQKKMKNKFKVPTIYMMPKIHKNPLKWRPIIPSHSWITSPISTIVDTLLSPIVKHHTIRYNSNRTNHIIPTIIKDSKNLINIINNLRIYDSNCWLITSDISSLYTNIPTTDGPNIVSKMVDNENATLVLILLRQILKLNFFEFNSKTYLQINGTAMGTNCAPNYANLYLVNYELPLINKFKENIIFYGRFIDDIFIILDSKCDINIFRKEFINMNPKLEFSFNPSKEKAEFLDIIFSKGPNFQIDGLLDTHVHQKNCNKYLYLPFKSQHPSHIKKSMITTELKRYIRISSNIKYYFEIRELFYLRLRSRGYKINFLLPIFNSVSYNIRNNLLKEKEEKPSKTDSNIFFSIEYNASTKQYSALLLRRLFQWKEKWQEELRLQGVSPLYPMLSFKSSPNFLKLLTTKSRLKYIDKSSDGEYEEKSSINQGNG